MSVKLVFVAACALIDTDGRVLIAERPPGSVHRRYFGHVSVDVAVIAARVERGIVAEFERSLSRAAACTQNWLESKTHRSVAARA